MSTAPPPGKPPSGRGVPAPDASRPPGPRSGVAMALFTTAYGVVAIGALAVGSILGKVHGTKLEPKVVLWVSAAVFVVFGVATTRRLARWLEQVVNLRSRTGAGRAFRVVVGIVGYTVVVFATLGLISVPLSHVAVGGAILGVVLGIAAQQALGNLFAGIVLLMARPFHHGDHIRVRSGALGGEFDGVVRAMNLTYVLIRTDQGLLHVPNSSMLAAAIGPWKKPPPTPPTPPTPAQSSVTAVLPKVSAPEPSSADGPEGRT
jgi:small-conductance mechanosensitive channel